MTVARFTGNMGSPSADLGRHVDADDHLFSRREVIAGVSMVGLTAPLAGEWGTFGLSPRSAGAAGIGDHYRFFQHDCVWNRRIDVEPAAVSEVLTERWIAAMRDESSAPSTLRVSNLAGWTNHLRVGVPVDVFVNRTAQVWRSDGSVGWPLARNNAKPYPAPRNDAIQLDTADNDWLGLRLSSESRPEPELWEGNYVQRVAIFGIRFAAYLVRWRLYAMKRG